MGERLSTWFPVALLAALALLTTWLDRAIQGPVAVRDAFMRHDPDYFVDTLLTTQMDVEGRIKNTLHATKMTHYPDDDSTDLEAPRFVSYQQRSQLTITARKGNVSSNGEHVYLHDDVRVVRAPHDDQSELVVNTEFLHVLPDDNIAKTDRPVTITDANMTVHATGLELNNETRILQLNSRVKGTYYDAKKLSTRPAE